MNIIELLKRLLDTHRSWRRAGTTTALINAANLTSGIVLVANEDNARRLRKSIEGAARVFPLADSLMLVGMEPRPLLVDNHLIMQACEGALVELESRQGYLEHEIRMHAQTRSELGQQLHTAKEHTRTLRQQLIDTQKELAKRPRVKTIRVIRRNA
jgi:septal ring factor EnvC (AmiA/AmiB activator)